MFMAITGFRLAIFNFKKRHGRMFPSGGKKEI